MPGPLLAVTISESARRGAIAGPLLMVGHMILEAVLVAAVVLGLASFLKNDSVIGVVGLLGGTVMCWMGLDMLRAVRGGITLRAETGKPGRIHPIAAGIVVSLSNPYWIIWWVTIGMAYIFMGLEFGFVGLIVFFCGHILSDFVWYTFVSVSIAKGRRMLSDRLYRGVLGACALFLITFGVRFLASGIGLLSTWMSP